MKRDLRLDAIRGFLLAEIAFVHTRAPGSFAVNEFFGRVSMAAAFVFLSGLVAGAVYGRIADASLTQCARVSARRALYIHKYHVGTFLVLCAVLLFAPSLIDEIDFGWMRDPDVAWRRVGEFLVLAFQPTFFVVLPLYAVFVLAMPLAFYGFRNGHGLSVLAVSFAIWTFAQLGIIDDRAFGGSFFNPLAWQLLYFTGLYIGYYQIHREQVIVRPHAGLIVLCCTIVLLGFSLRWNLVDWPDYVQNGTTLSNKTNHSILYVINFYAFTYLVYCLARRFPRLFTIPPLALLGQHSIQVFSFHIFVIYLTIPLMVTAREVSPWLGLFLGTTIVLSLFIPAIFRRWYKANKKSNSKFLIQKGREAAFSLLSR